MQKAGWVDGENIHLAYRFGGGNLVKIELRLLPNLSRSALI